MADVVGAEHFATPVDWRARRRLHDYTSLVTRPMDLQTLERSCAGTSFDYDEFCASASLIWSNARLYNGPSHPISRLADRLEALMCAKLAECEQNPHDDPDAARTASVMRPMVRALHLMDRFAVFDAPVDFEAEPGYVSVVDRPICLRQIMQGLDDASYVSVHDVVSDLQRVAANAKAYNAVSHPVHALAIDLETTIARLTALRVPDVAAAHFVTGEMRVELGERLAGLSDARRLQLAAMLRAVCPDALEGGPNRERRAFILEALSLHQFVRVDCATRAWVCADHET